ncbi:MAG TPA: glutamate-1-semialdehyde 2,1-aminomutase [Terracidiphilus sp.]|nr:glutamate-1-semialdehyde 2,1-aminomutase [Terracidiphilus sp.]
MSFKECGYPGRFGWGESQAIVFVAAQKPPDGGIAKATVPVEDDEQPTVQICELIHIQPDVGWWAKDARKHAEDVAALELAGVGAESGSLYTERTMSSKVQSIVRDRSHKLQQRAEHFFPGGVNSPVRAFRAVGGAPPFVERGDGAYLYDADGNRYIDYFGSWGPMILGHAFPPVVEAIERAARKSASFGASTAAEADLAEHIVACYPVMEKLRFVSSGTEATMSAIRLARAATGRKLIVKFEGCYHGHADGLLVKAGSGVATFGIPGSAGVPEEIARLTHALPYNDLAAVEAAFDAHPNEIAAVILEPVVGNAGCIPPMPGYLQGLRALTEREDALLIVDEVMTGFRVALGGALELYGIDADLVTLGKIVGGGLPVGVFGGKKKYMDQLSPLGPVYQAGTLSGNPLAMAAGIAMVGYLRKHADEVYPQLEATSKAVAEGVAAEAAKAQVALTLNRVGAMWTWFFASESVTNYEDAAKSDIAAFGRFHRAMMEQGVWLPPSQFEAAFLSTAHGEKEVQMTIEAAREAFVAIKK